MNLHGVKRIGIKKKVLPRIHEYLLNDTDIRENSCIRGKNIITSLLTK